MIAVAGGILLAVAVLAVLPYILEFIWNCLKAAFMLAAFSAATILIFWAIDLISQALRA